MQLHPIVDRPAQGTMLRNSQLAARLLSIRYWLAFCAVPRTMVENDDTHHPAHLSLLGQ
jgi:hypothetical protein